MLGLHGLTREDMDEISAALTHLINEKMKREGLVSKFILARKPKEKDAIYEEWCNLVNVDTDGHIDNTASTFITNEIIDELLEHPPKQEPIVQPKPDYVKFHSRWGR